MEKKLQQPSFDASSTEEKKILSPSTVEEANTNTVIADLRTQLQNTMNHTDEFLQRHNISTLENASIMLESFEAQLNDLYWQQECQHQEMSVNEAAALSEVVRNLEEQINELYAEREIVYNKLGTNSTKQVASFIEALIREVPKEKMEEIRKEISK